MASVVVPSHFIGWLRRLSPDVADELVRLGREILESGAVTDVAGDLSTDRSHLLPVLLALTAADIASLRESDALDLLDFDLGA